MNPLQKIIARISEKWVREFLQKRSADFFFAHITESDYQGYLQWAPDHKGFVVPAGVESQGIPFTSSYDGILRLLFVGSLSVKMNYDALAFFQKKFWHVLKDEFKQNIEMTVLGSQPSRAVQHLCSQEDWLLLPDASDDELRAQYGRATFLVAPFPYTNGAKLKLLNSLAAGLPVLATTNMNYLPEQAFFPNLYSDEPQEWCNLLRKLKDTGISSIDRIKCYEYASRYSWKSIAGDMHKVLQELGW